MFTHERAKLVANAKPVWTHRCHQWSNIDKAMCVFGTRRKDPYPQEIQTMLSTIQWPIVWRVCTTNAKQQFRGRQGHDQRHVSHAISNTMNTMRWQVELGHNDSSEPRFAKRNNREVKGCVTLQDLDVCRIMTSIKNDFREKCAGTIKCPDRKNENPRSPHSPNESDLVSLALNQIRECNLTAIPRDQGSTFTLMTSTHVLDLQGEILE